MLILSDVRRHVHLQVQYQSNLHELLYVRLREGFALKEGRDFLKSSFIYLLPMKILYNSNFEDSCFLLKDDRLSFYLLKLVFFSPSGRRWPYNLRPSSSPFPFTALHRIHSQSAMACIENEVFS